MITNVLITSILTIFEAFRNFGRMQLEIKKLLIPFDEFSKNKLNLLL